MNNNHKIDQQNSFIHRYKALMGLLAALVFLGLSIALVLVLNSNKQYQAAKKAAQLESLQNIETQIYDASSLQKNNVVSAETAIASGNNYAAALLSQQTKIEELQKKYEALILELNKIRNQDKISKLVITFVELNNNVTAQKNYQEELQKFEILSASDQILVAKIARLKVILSNDLKTSSQLQQEFRALIPKIIANKSVDHHSGSVIFTIKNAVANLVTIRRVDGQVRDSQDNVDFIVLETERLIEQKKYRQALNLLDSLENKYQPLLTKFVFDLQNIAQLQELNEEIFNYFKNLQD